MFEILTLALVGGVVYVLYKTKKLPSTEVVERHQEIIWGDWGVKASAHPGDNNNITVENHRLGSNGLPFYTLVDTASNVHYAVRNLPPGMTF